MFWNVPIENLAQEPLAETTTNLDGMRKPPRQFHDSMIEKRHPCFKRNRHARTIDFRQNIIGKIGHQIEELHSIEQIGEIIPHGSVPENSAGFGDTRGYPTWIPVANQLPVQFVSIVQAQD